MSASSDSTFPPHVSATPNAASGAETTLWRSKSVVSPVSRDADAIQTTGEFITWVGRASEAPASDTTVDLGATVVTPAFVDSHAHMLFTGSELSNPSLSAATSAESFLDIVASHAATLAPSDPVILRGWDETTWADATFPETEKLVNAAGGRDYYFPRACGHIGLASPSLVAAHPQLAQLDGYDAGGIMRQAAHRATFSLLTRHVGLSLRQSWNSAALKHAASLGVAAVVECAISTDDPYCEQDFQQLLALGERSDHPAVFGWWAELCAAEKARDLGAYGCGGDLNMDGSIGARTAALKEPYFDEESTSGHLYLTADQVHEHLLDCRRFGLPAAFHSIGDAATATVIDAFHKLAAHVDVEEIRLARHRVEHCEMVDKDLIAGLVKYGLYASVQPSFDAAWGGLEKMYASRLGKQRSLEANPLASLAGVGVPLAFGSDSPVTAIDPWGGVRAAVHLHNPTQRLGMATAFAAATRGGWRALGIDDAGAIMPGQRAHFAAWEIAQDSLDATGLPDIADQSVATPRCGATVSSGHLIHQN
ncbi:amidohydrolase [Natronoglycomyces albus]|uniref:Amidohydrolase family protein n=1 Tax=Natronoglycomyces albus TaxID=2811108 RepID=A0A895XW61_9ACTN|nr:amidohydrolase family protein [Natronoglycomyces albus]QSB06766.1 amidohydrolase family protein [Natronoglycomyces albus]